MNSVVDGVGAYDTNDIVSPHPTKEGLWKVVGRADEQIMHSTGEKVSIPEESSHPDRISLHYMLCSDQPSPTRCVWVTYIVKD